MGCGALHPQLEPLETYSQVKNESNRCGHGCAIANRIWSCARVIQLRFTANPRNSEGMKIGVQ